VIDLDGAPARPPSELPPSAPALRLAGVTVAYRERPVLEGIDLTIERGERVALLGPNGAGKSTLLRVATGILPVDAGEVELVGRSVRDLDRLTAARHVAVVPQQASLPFAARVEEVVALGRLPHEDPFRGPRPADRAAVAAAIERVGLGHLIGRDARELSLGERQLVLIALAVAQSAPLLLLDEPTVHLDLRHRVEAMELLVDLNERDGTTVLAILHDVTLAAHFFPRLVLLDRGRIVADGVPDEVLSADRIRGVFGVDPALVVVGPAR
jgi:iron complex transport system ATP-binding protein